jgi:hypothetical protein
MGAIANTTLSNTFDFWRQRTNETSDRLNQFARNKSMLYANTVVANNVLKALGNTVFGVAGKKHIFNGNLAANGNISITKNLTITGNTSFGSVLANGAFGTSNQVLRTNGSGGVFWATISTGSGNVSNTYLNANFAKLSGANFVGACDFGNNNVTGAKLKNYKENVNSLGSLGASQAIDLSTSNIFDMTLSNPTCTITITNPPASGVSYSFTMIVRQDSTGNRTITWPASVKWPNGTAPTLSTAANAVDILTFMTVDGGTKYFAGLALGNMT